MKRTRPVAAPYGIPTSVLFYGHNPGEAYASASKIKTLDVHPVLPWAVTADEDGTVTVWDYASETMVQRFNVDGVKDGQRAATEALDAQAAFAAASGLAVPADVTGLGIGTAPAADPGSTIGPAVEGFVAALTSGAGVPRPRRHDDARTGRTGAVRSVCFADEYVLSLYGGVGRGDYEDFPIGGSSDGAGAAAPHTYAPPLPLACSVGELASMLSGATPDPAGDDARAGAGRAPQHWLVVVCEQRTLVVDMVTRGTIDVPHAALLVEVGGGGSGVGGSGGGGAPARTLTKGRPSAFSAAPLGRGVLAFGCEDGAIRVWSADAAGVIQTLRPGGPLAPGGGGAASASAASGASGRPVTHLSLVCSSPHALGGAALSPASAGGAAARGARAMLVAGSADGSVATWDVVVGGRQVAPAPTTVLRLGADLVALSVSPVTLQAVALGADKCLAAWDVSARPVASGGAPPRALLAPRVVTASPAAETGAGSRLTAAVSLAGHAYFPPSTLLVAGKGPHLELLVPGAPDRAGEAGALLLDLRTARPGLPAKLKVYVLAAHPFRPELVIAGTNVGVFAVAVAPHYGVGALAASHGAWALPSGVEAAAGGGDAAAAAPVVREGRLVVHATAAGTLVATEVTAATPAESEGGDAALVVTTARRRAAVAAPPPLPAAPHAQVDAAAYTHTLLPNFAPPGSVPASLLSGAAHALSALQAQARAAGAAPGARGVRLRVSGSGRYLSAAWPEHRCYAIYRLNFGALTSSCGGGGGGGARASAWNAEYVEGGPGLDVAWAGPTVDFFDDTFTGGGDGTPAPPTATTTRSDRYVVLEPGVPVTGRGPMGGGMAIGTKPVAAGSGARRGAAAAKKGAAAAAGSGGVALSPASLVLTELPAPPPPQWPAGTAAADGSDDDAPPLPIPKPTTLIARIPIAASGEPVAVWGGPVLAVASAPDGAAGLTGATLAFYSWALADPPQRSAEEEAKEAALAARYSGLAPGGARQPRLLLAGSTAPTPAPSAAAAASGCGVLWSDDGARLAVCTPHAVHVMAATAAPAAARAAAVTVVELCRAPLVAVSAAWDGAGGLLVATADARTALVLPPLVLEPRLLVGDGAADALAAAQRGRGLAAAVIDVQSLVPPPDFPSAVPNACALPAARRGTGNPAHCCPIAVLRGHAVTLHWAGPRGGAGGPAPPLGAGAGAPATVPGSTPLLGTAPLLSPALRAARALTSAGGGGDGGGAYAAAVVAAAQWASRLPHAAHDDAALLLASLGGLAAALMLPGLLPEHGVPLALARRGDAFAGAAANAEGGPAAVDAAVAIAYLCRLAGGAGAGAAATLLALGGPVGGGVAAAARGGPLSAWPQVAAYLAVASRAAGSAGRGAAGGVGDADGALHALARRCLDAGLRLDAALVAAAASGAAGGAAWAEPLLDEALR